MKFLIQATQLEPTQKPQAALYDSKKTNYTASYKNRSPYQWEVSATHPEYFGGERPTEKQRSIQ